VQGSGAVTVGRAYTSQLNLKAGDGLQVKVNEHDLQLLPIIGSAAAVATPAPVFTPAAVAV